MIRSIINTLILIFPVYLFSQVNVNIGDIPIGKSVIISYDVKVDKPFPSMINQVSAQGTISGSNFSNVLTDDPDAMGANDPTITPVVSPSVNLSISQTSGSEIGLTAITVTATNDEPVVGDQYVYLDVSGSGITFGDYSVSGYQINIANGSSSGSITFYIQDDLLVEGDEVAMLSLYGPSAGLILGSSISQSLTIVDNELCGAGGITINTQAQANAFRATYPGCLAVGGDLIINDDDGMGNDLINLDSLAGLTKVNGALGVYYNPLLTNLNPLQTITSVGGDISIFQNELLPNLSGLSGLSRHASTFSVYENNAMTTLNGIHNLTVFNNLNIYGNPLLTNLNGLANTDTINGYFYLSNNDVLNDVSGLSSVNLIGSTFTISSNPALVSIRELTQLTSLSESLYIADNASLQNLDGFLFLESISLDLYIDNNGALSDYCGLYTIMDKEVNMGGTAIGGTITITNNAIDPSPSDIVMNGPCGSIQNERTGQRYMSLQDAINDADPMGTDTIIFLDNIEESFVAYNSAYIQSNGFTLTIPDDIPDVQFGSMEIYTDVKFIWLGGTIIVSPTGYIVNDGTLHNNGTIIYQGGTGTFENGGIYKGTGSFQGNFLNYGTVKPGN